MKKSVFVLLSALICLCSCSDSGKDDTKKTVARMMKKPFVLNGHRLPAGLCIVSYVDSTGCTSCKLRLEQWAFLADGTAVIPRAPKKKN